MNILKPICCLFIMLVLFQHNAVSQTQKYIINASATVMIRVVDQYINDGVKTDNSIPEEEKYFSLNAEIDPVYINGNKFSGVYYSNSFFMYKEVMFVEGEFSSDKKSITWIQLDYRKTLFSGDPEISMYSTDETKILLKFKNIPLSRGSVYQIDNKISSLVDVKYEKLHFGQSTHDRSEIYEEYFLRIKPGIGNFGCDITTLTGMSVKERGVNVRVSPLVKTDDEQENSTQHYLASRIIADLSKIPGVKIYEGMFTDYMVQEAMLVETGLVNREEGIDPEIQSKMLSMNVDISILVYAKRLSNAGETPSFLTRIIFTKGETMVTLDQVTKGGEYMDAFIDRATSNISHEIRRIKETDTAP